MSDIKAEFYASTPNGVFIIDSYHLHAITELNTAMSAIHDLIKSNKPFIRARPFHKNAEPVLINLNQVSQISMKEVKVAKAVLLTENDEFDPDGRC